MGRAMIRALSGDCRAILPTLPDESVHCVVTSPPYWGLRDYGVPGQLGLEPTHTEYVDAMVAVFREVRRVLRKDGTCWLNLGDSYAAQAAGRCSDDPMRTSTLGGGKKTQEVGRATKERRQYKNSVLPIKNLIGIPWRVAFALQADGWYLRQDIIWNKPNPMPESVTDRCTKAHEYLFLLTKSARYYYDAEAIAEAANWPEGSWARSKCYDDDQSGMLRSFYGKGARWQGGETRNKRSVWTVATQPFSGARLLRGAGGGSGRKVSRDCPLHGDQSTRATTDQRDEQLDAFQSDRSPHTDSCHAKEPGAALAPIAMPRAEDFAPDSSGLLDRSCSQTANDHSNRSHRTARAPETSPRASAVAASPPRTADSEPQLGMLAMCGRIPESKSAEGCEPSGPPTDRAAQMAPDTARMCTCEDNSTFTDHFAVFPPALIEPAILAGCPKGGTVLDPFGGAGTTGLVADRLQRNAILIELNPAYGAMADNRIWSDAPLFYQAWGVP
jgi:DNA modification methylase